MMRKGKAGAEGSHRGRRCRCVAPSLAGEDLQRLVDASGKGPRFWLSALYFTILRPYTIVVVTLVTAPDGGFAVVVNYMNPTAETRFRAEVPSEEYWRRQIKCQYACPVHTDSRGYIRAIAEGDYEGAYL